MKTKGVEFYFKP